MKFRKLTNTHAGRIVLAAVPVAVAATLIMGGVANGAVPVSFSVSGSQFQISASLLEGSGFSQYAGVTNDTAGKAHPVAIANIRSAKLSDLCQSVVTDTPLGKVGMLITAGGGDKPAEASDLQIGMTDLKGDSSFGNIRIGVDASTVNTSAKGAAGDFAQDADTIKITGLQQTAWSTQASVFTLNGMHVQLTDGSKGCF
ncbi:MAG TPA: DUF6230 family protein [Lacisediminihabitans sp.]|jgi:hypothetical protein|nr:DUF6230 family protein [Lacisediminihabitans sp.]HXD60742.1 DUF6230 family protein [Lacisediminihabitans sp.]